MPERGKIKEDEMGEGVLRKKTEGGGGCMPEIGKEDKR